MPFIKESRPPHQPRMATRVKKSEFAGVGALVQLIGVGMGWLFFPVGLIPCLLLLVIGGRMAIVRVCSDCRGKVDKKASVCPHCRASLIDG